MFGTIALRFLSLPAVALMAAGVGRGEIDYGRDVKPLLQERCYACHGALKQAGGLRLDTAAFIRQGGDSGPAMAPGDPAGSRLLGRVMTADLDDRMPPEHEGEPFKAGEIQVLRDWIAAGASAPADEVPEADPRDHWAFRPLQRPPVPVVEGAWGRHPIDAFVARQHQENGLTPQSEAPREVLLRRLYFDLIGLPPSPAETAAAWREPEETWYESTVERLLGDPRHGERWARHWMDVWRYSDWWGLGDQLRNSQKHMWHWRDWIIESLNEDVSYAEMVRLMLAADELHPGDLKKLRATGFLARNYFLFNRHPWMEETVEHVSKGFLGLTMNCAKCHDHKYDPVSQQDYYRMRAFFEPYHVRLDMVPGEVDVERDGVPRVYDGLLDEPTWRFVRGDESRPDKSAAIAPGLPGILAFRELDVRPVVLPPVAWQPERQPWVIDAHVAAAQAGLAAAEAAVVGVREQAERAERQLAEVLARPSGEGGALPGAEALVAEAFASLDLARWQLVGGEWVHEAGRLEQRGGGQTTAALQWREAAPRDFEVMLRFTTLGGGTWRSVGISFDATRRDPDRPDEAVDGSEVSVYASAHDGGPKVQASFRQGPGAAWQYPAEAAVARAVTVGREHTLRLQVRDTLVNVSFDGEPAVAWRSPLARRDGVLQFTTFDALAVFHEITVAPLSEEVVLREPAAGLADPVTPDGARAALALAQGQLAVSEQAVAVARASLRSVESRGAAMRAFWDQLAGEGEARLEAVRSERVLAAAEAGRVLAEKELRVLQAAGEARAEAEKECQAAREAKAAAELAAAEPVGSEADFTRLPGAKWTATRFGNSSADDPVVSFPAQSTGRRRALAEWITDPRHPLTARVAVNHLWTRHMGTPLVATVFDFGRKGASPTHPELLDWLAAEFVDHGWSMKHLHRLILTSSVYRLSSSVAGAAETAARDPDNRHLWRRTPVRLDAEVVRDSILSHAGQLDPAMGGPPVPSGGQEESTRRSLYFFHSNNERNLFLTTFDGAAVKECYRREASIVPQQALALSNSRLVDTASQKIAERFSEPAAAGGPVPDDSLFIRRLWLSLLGVEAGEAEVAACERALARWRALEPGQPPGGARVHLVWSLLNHTDFVTQR